MPLELSEEGFVQLKRVYRSVCEAKTVLEVVLQELGLQKVEASAEAEEQEQEDYEETSELYKLNKTPIAKLDESMKNMEFYATIYMVKPVATFTYPNGQQGKVQNILVTDGSGTIKLTLWNEQVDAFSKLKLQEGDDVHIRAWKITRDKKGVQQLILGQYGHLLPKAQVPLTQEG